MALSLFGMEAELALCATQGDQNLPVALVAQVMTCVAQRTLIHLPGGASRMFLTNGGLFYLDVGAHPEMATPECTNPADAVAYKLAGERIVAGLSRAARDELRADAVHVYRSNVDYSGATWGCHESYLGHRPVTTYQHGLIPHLASRIVYTGSGGLDPTSPGIRFSVSPRVAYIDQVASHESTSDRGIFHTRDEPLCNGYSRIHVLAGDNACSQRAEWLKFGTTALVVALADAMASRGNWPRLADPVAAMKGFARDRSHRARVHLGRRPAALMTAIELQRHILACAEASVGTGRLPPWAAEVCGAWRSALELVESPNVEDSQVFDWPIKFGLFRREILRSGFTEPEILAWSDALEHLANRLPQADDEAAELGGTATDPLHRCGAWSRSDRDQARRLLAASGLTWERFDDFTALRQQLCAIDIRFGEIDSGIFDTLDRHGAIPHHRVVSEERIRQAVAEAPRDTRAHPRGMWVRRLGGGDEPFQCRWDAICGKDTLIDLGDPFRTEAEWQTSVDPLACRHLALARYREGRYRDAERLLTTALDTGFEPAGMHCHLARICLVTGRVDTARRHAERAWAMRAAASPYVLPRLLWTRLAVAYLDSNRGSAPDGRSAEEAGMLLGNLKWMLQQTSVVVVDWEMQPVLVRLASRLPHDQHEILAALHRAISDGHFDELESIECWRDQQALAV